MTAAAKSVDTNLVAITTQLGGNKKTSSDLAIYSPNTSESYFYRSKPIYHNVRYTIKSEPNLICTNAMANYFLPTLESHKQVSPFYHFHRDVACAQAKNTHAAIADIYFTELVLGSLIDLANSQGHEISDVKSLYEFSEMARLPTHLSFSKDKCEAIADLAASSDGASYLKWLLKQDSVDSYLVQACQQVLKSV